VSDSLNFLALAHDLPDEVLGFLVRSAPPREVWKWLGEDDQFKLRSDLTRGFQGGPNALRQPIVRIRFTQVLRSNDQAFEKLLELWTQTSPHILHEVRAQADDELGVQLPRLWQTHGGEALLLALIYEKREAALDAYAELDPATFDENQEPQNQEVEVQESGAGWDESASALSEEAANEFDQAKIQSLKSEIELWREKAESAQAGMGTLQRNAEREKQAVALKAKQEERKRIALESELQELKKTSERTARRHRQSEKSCEESQVENKRLKRQLRQAQQLHEELRKQIAGLTGKLNELSPPEIVPVVSKIEPKIAPQVGRNVPKISPFDQEFVWNSDGRAFRVSPRAVGRAIERNDEEFVFSLIQAFDALREKNAQGYKLFIESVRSLNRYYARVLTAETTRVLIDASNVARYEKDNYGKGQLRHLLSMRDELRLRDCFPILIYADASLSYNIDEPGELIAMAKRGELEIAPSGTEADELLAREARRSGAYVVTNDRNFHLKVSPDFEPPRITFRILDNFLIVDDF